MQPKDFETSVLAQFYQPQGHERVGFILHNGNPVEVPNAAPFDPDAPRFEVKPDIMIAHEDIAWATWHTHPGASGNLSIDDYWAFKNWPTFIHYIVGSDGVWTFRVDQDGKVLRS